MKVLVERDKFLSDFEVLEHLKSSQFIKDKKKNKHAGVELEVITNEMLSYLNERPCALQTTENFTQLMEFLNGFDLVKIEKLQIVNSLPRSMVHLFALVDEADQRFEEDKCASIIDKINELFPLPGAQEEEEEQEA